MTFVSYAQNNEDVMLWRALKHIQNGFYIDVGAAWPNFDSVTKAFYDRGWSGINLEPNPGLYQQLIENRSRDINLPQAVGNKIDSVPFFLMDDTGLSTAMEEIADKHLQARWDHKCAKVDLTTLERIFQQYIVPGNDVHFLKVDVEGMEKFVLEGNDWMQYRPWIVLVEASLPMTQIESHGEWETILLDANYKFVYADGLNRFYLAQEHSELLAAFAYPPNVWDGYILAQQQDAEAKAQHAEAKAKHAEAKAEYAEAEAQELITQIHAIYASRSWRITAPLRWLGEKRCRTFPKNFRQKTRVLLGHAALYIGRRPRLKAVLLVFFNRLPKLKVRLARIAHKSLLSSYQSCFINSTAEEIEAPQLTPRARSFLAELKTMIERKQAGEP